MIQRQLEKIITEKLFKGKTIVLTGPRQVGKTTLLRKIVAEQGMRVLLLDGDNPELRPLLVDAGKQRLAQIIGPHEIIFIDEAQGIPGIGTTAKLINDYFNDRQLILSGSSSFELAQHMREPLTGRKWSFHLWPISWAEWEAHKGFLDAELSLEQRLVFGFYPDVLNHSGEEARTLKELVDSYLFKDVLSYGSLRKPSEVNNLLKALAWQVGQEVKYSELSQLVGLDGKTVSSYIDVLEQAYIVFRVPAFSRNHRNEIKQGQKIYFHDNGVRNALIGKLDLLPIRSDKGQLWENFLMSERYKQHDYRHTYQRMYFWRTKQQQEIDLIEEGDGRLQAFEFKWSTQKKARFPLTFTRNYDSATILVNRENFREFLKS